MTYRCTKCLWRGSDPVPVILEFAPGVETETFRCPIPSCGSSVEDLDLLERKAIRQDAGFSEEEAERLAREDLEKWMEDLA